MILKRKSIKRRMKIDRCRLIDEDRQAFRRICNPPLKNVLTYLGFADLQSATSSLCFWGLLLGDYKSPGFNRSNLFLRRISNPPGRLAGLRSWLLFCYCIAVFIKNGAIAYLPFGREIIFAFQRIIGSLICYYECAGTYGFVGSGII